MEPDVIPMNRDIWNHYDNRKWEELIDQENHESIVTTFLNAWQKFSSILKYDFSVNNVVNLEYTDLITAIQDENLPNFLENQPDKFFLCLSVSFHMFLLPCKDDIAGLNSDSYTTYYSSYNPNHSIKINTCSDYPERIVSHLLGYPKITPMETLRSSSINNFVSLRGTIVRVSNIKPILTSVYYKCSKCGAESYVLCKDGIPYPPVSCTPHCSNTNFILCRDSAVTTDWQRLRLQEIVDLKSRGRAPLSKDIEVTGYEVDRCVPGDVVTISGFVRSVSISENRGIVRSRPGATPRNRSRVPNAIASQINKNPIHDIYIEAMDIQNSKNSVQGRLKDPRSSEYGSSVNESFPRLQYRDVLELSLQEMYGILQIANHPHTFPLICASICPSIFGHYLVKAGLTLAIFGGGHTDYENEVSNSLGSPVSIRSDIHVLIVGDPGLGKSQLLLAISNLSPRGVYVCGSYSTASGLTVSIHKESGSQDYTLEAGALVLANSGIACIDELDKMSSDLDALLESMEQQQISVAKAGIVCNLPAKVSIIAAANPRHGHYNKAKSISENLNMSTALLSRFDLIFVLLDKANIENDQSISNHVIAQHAIGIHSSRLRDSGEGPSYPEFKIDHEISSVAGLCNTDNYFCTQNDNNLDGSTFSESTPRPPRVSLLERLKNFRDCDSNTGFLPAPLLNRYISYSKKYVASYLTDEAKLTLQNFYLNLRRSQRSQDGTPVTTRQLESLIRLAEARAKLELREEVTEKDVLDVIEIMKSSLRDAIDTNGDESFETLNVRMTGKRGKASTAQKFFKVLRERAKRQSKYEWTNTELYSLSKELKLVIPATSFDEFIEYLNLQQYILKSNKKWKVFMGA